MIEKLIDVHCLAGTDYWLSKNKRELEFENNLLEYEQVLKKYVRDYKTIIMPFPSSKDGTYFEENNEILRLSQKYAFAEPVIAFNYQSEENVRFVFEALEQRLVKGVVLWPILCDMDLTRIKDNVYFNELVEKYDCLVTVHVGAGNEAEVNRVKKLNNYCPMDAVNLAKQYPKVKFNLAHLLRASEQALEEAKLCENIIIDTSGISTHLRWYEHNTNIFPAKDANELKKCSSQEIIHKLMNCEGISKKMVFGTQYPFGKWYGYGLLDEINLILESDLLPEQQADLFYRNFEAFMGEN